MVQKVPSEQSDRFEEVGLLVQGDNHFVVRGPRPDREQALALVRHWSIIRIGSTTPANLTAWRISNREFRENLRWAVAVPGQGVRNPAVLQLLEELAARGVALEEYSA